MPKPQQQTSQESRPSWVSERPDGFVLIGSKDLKTGKCIFPRIPETSPSASRYAAIELSRRGEIYSFTVIHPNPKTGEKPFTLAYVDFPEGARAFGRLHLPAGETAKVGKAVEVCVQSTVEAGTLYHFIPAKEQA
ncbi:DUF35 OB-fold domain-containing protein, acyl-CoA-associated [Bradyrhizobium sp. Rc2d]|uniref:Zn-ribbon domain-containing OB-fold protein n=1 Tax=Bradyrhizobium sp. Rc2d TaxID=1855321 RepID=UPI000891AD7B|nr:OB-fold domain-containing protein [Bradyrhizobium sp. Rc2d]SDJ53664.1 DUF35 OB-fold domain-containing protein, acyl-CoA-associated [Bradyrhizobium sp. Rc2d]